MSFRTFLLSLLTLSAVFFLFSAFFSSPVHKVTGESSLVAFYNVENLFDTFDDPHTSDNDFLPQSLLQWDQEKFNHKIDRLSEVIGKLDQEGLILLGLAEIENEQVLDRLLKANALSSKEYSYLQQDSQDPRGIDVALLYQKKKFSPLFHKFLRPCFEGECLESRDILAVKGLMKKDTVWVFVNHWPSRRAGQAQSEPKRLLVAKVLKHCVDSILNKSPLSKIIIMGDFNDLPTDPSLKLLTKERKLVNVFNDEGVMKTGSIKYKKDWLQFDQILCSANAIGTQKGHVSYQEKSAAVYNPDFLYYNKDKKNGPYRSYRGQKYYGGYSDHFPVYIKLNY